MSLLFHSSRTPLLTLNRLNLIASSYHATALTTINRDQSRSTTRKRHLTTSKASSSSSTPSSSSPLPPLCSARPLLIHNLPSSLPIPYLSGWHWQKRLVRDKVECEKLLKSRCRDAVGESGAETEQQRSAFDPQSMPQGFADRLLLLSHSSIYTLGRNSLLAHIRFPPHIRLNVIERGSVSQPVFEAAASAQGTAPFVRDETDSTATQAEQTTYEVVRVERGGEVTFHGPGQLIIYPILALNPTPIPRETNVKTTMNDADKQIDATDGRIYRADLHWFLRSLESVIIRFLQLYEIEGERIEGASGVWVDMTPPAASSSSASTSPSSSSPSSPRCLQKIAAMGLSCTSWISMHGCALNIDNDLSPFEWIVPCGLEDKTKYGGVTTLKLALQRRGTENKYPIDHARVRQQIIECFTQQFGIKKQLITVTDQPPQFQDNQ